MYTLLNAPRIQEQCGRMGTQDVAVVLSGYKETAEDGSVLRYPPDRLHVITDAMLEFELCYRLDNGDFVIPDLLPPERPADLHFERRGALRFDFDCEGLLPRHVIANLIVKRHAEIVTHPGSGKRLEWQNGVRLHSHNHGAEALLIADYHLRRLSLWVTGAHAGQYFAALHDTVLGILQAMEKLRYAEWLHLPNSARLSGEPLRERDVPRTDYRDLLAKQADGEKILVCKYGRYNLLEVMKLMPHKTQSPPPPEKTPEKRWSLSLTIFVVVLALIEVSENKIP